MHLYIYLSSKPLNSYQVTLKAYSDNLSKIHANHGGVPTQKRGRQKQGIERTTTSHHSMKQILETRLAKNTKSSKPFHITIPPPKAE